MTAWYKIKGNKLGWWRKYRGERGRWESVLCRWYLSHQTPLAPQVLHVQLPLLTNGAGHGLVAPCSWSGWGEGQCHGLFPLSFPKPLLRTGSLKTWWWWIVKAPADAERLGSSLQLSHITVSGQSCLSPFLYFFLLPGAEADRRVPFLKEEHFAGYNPTNRSQLCTKMDFGSVVGPISHCSWSITKSEHWKSCHCHSFKFPSTQGWRTNTKHKVGPGCFWKWPSHLHLAARNSWVWSGLAVESGLKDPKLSVQMECLCTWCLWLLLLKRQEMNPVYKWPAGMGDCSLFAWHMSCPL